MSTTPQARSLSRAQHLQGQPIASVANPRALAAKFLLPDGKSTDVLALSVEGFPARTPDEFLAFLRAQRPDPVSGQPAPDAFPRFLESHPATRAFLERVMHKPVPASYVQTNYYGEHAFRFAAPDGTSRIGSLSLDT